MKDVVRTPVYQVDDFLDRPLADDVRAVVDDDRDPRRPPSLDGRERVVDQLAIERRATAVGVDLRLDDPLRPAAKEALRVVPEFAELG